MLENDLPPNSPPATPPASSTPPGSTGGNPNPAEWRAPAGSRFAGMTAEQVLGISEALIDTRETPTPAPAAPPAPSFDIADDEYVSGAQIKRIMQNMQAGGSNAVELAASANISIVRGKHASDFAKYGREIDTLVAQVPAHLRTIDNLERCVKMVRSDHLDEIAAERAQQLVSGMAPTLRSNGSAAPPAPISREHTLEAEHVPAEWKRRAEANGITESIVADFCRANDMTIAAFYEQFKTPMNKIVADVPIKRQA